MLLLFKQTFHSLFLNPNWVGSYAIVALCVWKKMSFYKEDTSSQRVDSSGPGSLGEIPKVESGE